MARVLISAVDVHEAADRWDQCVPSQLVDSFHKFLGVENFVAVWRVASDSFALNEEAARKIRLLLGPHYKAIIKAYLIKSEVEP